MLNSAVPCLVKAPSSKFENPVAVMPGITVMGGKKQRLAALATGTMKEGHDFLRALLVKVAGRLIRQD